MRSLRWRKNCHAVLIALQDWPKSGRSAHASLRSLAFDRLEMKTVSLAPVPVIALVGAAPPAQKIKTVQVVLPARNRNREFDHASQARRERNNCKRSGDFFRARCPGVSGFQPLHKAACRHHRPERGGGQDDYLRRLSPRRKDCFRDRGQLGPWQVACENWLEERIASRSTPRRNVCRGANPRPSV